MIRARARSVAVQGARARRAVAWAAAVLVIFAGAPDRASAAGKTTPANSEARAQAKAAVTQAQIDYKLGLFQSALDGYRRAYELFQVPVLLFDIGQCHRNLGNPEKAKFFFEGYLREETRMDPERRRLTEELIVEAAAALERQQAAAAAARAATSPRPRRSGRPRIRLEAVDDRPTAPQLGLDAAASERAPGDHRSILRRWWFWTAVLGAGGLVGGAVYYATGAPRLIPPSGSIGTLDRAK
jgi:tetratricopeptide (TPR) repeat protein